MLSGPLLLFNPWFVSTEQSIHEVGATLGTDQAHVDSVTGPMLADLFRGGDFEQSLDGGAPILDSSERSHMRDVGDVARSLLTIEVVAVLTLVLTWRRLRPDRRRRGSLLQVAAGAVGLLAISGGIFFAVAFDAAFAAFHSLFFAAGTWQFGPDSNLIRLFPEPFWFEASLLAGATIVIGALVATLVGRSELRSATVSA